MGSHSVAHVRMSSGKPASPMSQIRAAEPVAVNLSFFLIPHGNPPPSPVQHPINEADDSLLGNPCLPGPCSGTASGA